MEQQPPTLDYATPPKPTPQPREKIPWSMLILYLPPVLLGLFAAAYPLFDIRTGSPYYKTWEAAIAVTWFMAFTYIPLALFVRDIGRAVRTRRRRE